MVQVLLVKEFVNLHDDEPGDGYGEGERPAFEGERNNFERDLEGAVQDEDLES